MQLTSVLLLLLNVGCVRDTTVLQTGRSHPAISPSQVRIYLTAPPNAEVIGIASGTDTSRLSRQRAQDGALDDLKKKAAKLGANGLVIKQTGFSLEEHEQNITAMAIYVP